MACDHAYGRLVYPLSGVGSRTGFKRESRKVGDCLYELYRPDQCVLGFGHNKSVVYRAGVVILCVIACMQQEQLDRVVCSAESGALGTDGIIEVRNTESEKRIEAERAH